MIGNFIRARTLCLAGAWLLLAACDGTNSDRVADPNGGTGGSFAAADAGERGSFGGTGSGGTGVGHAGSDAGATAVGPGGSGAGDESGESGDGGLSGASPAAGASSSGGASESGGATSGGSTGHGGGAAIGELMIPCHVYAALSVCRTCHIDPPIAGAPMPLVTLRDLQTDADGTYQAIQTGTMPAAGELSAQEARLILDWLDAGARGVTKNACP